MLKSGHALHSGVMSVTVFSSVDVTDWLGATHPIPLRVGAGQEPEKIEPFRGF